MGIRWIRYLQRSPAPTFYDAVIPGEGYFIAISLCTYSRLTYCNKQYPAWGIFKTRAVIAS